MTLSPLSHRIAATLRDGGERPAIEYDEVWCSWADVHALAAQINDVLAPDIRRVGLVARNRPTTLAALLGLLATGRTIVMLHGAQAPERLAQELRDLRLAAIIGEEVHFTAPVIEAARAAGARRLTLPNALSKPVDIERPQAQPATFACNPDIALELLSSGTTGPPKRIPITWRTLEAALGAAHGTALDGQAADTLTGAALPPAISGLSLGNIGGIYMMLPSALIGQRIVLLDRFAVAPWARAVRLYRPEMLSVQPAGLRMILDADVPRADLASLRWIVSGASPLDPELQDAFEARYGCRVFGAYGATETCGSIVVWTDALYDQFRQTKRGSVGRPTAGVEVRIVDPESGALLPADAVGLLEAKVDRVGPDWIRTTDFATLDADGFVFIKGRSDNAINRGGYKVLPDDVADVLRRHPAVRDAAVVGLPDRRLGELPVAALELKPGAAPPGQEELRAFAKQSLLAYQVPARFLVVDELPRNASLKVLQPAVRERFQAGVEDIFLVFVDGKTGRETDYRAWFAGAHMSDMEKLPGVASAHAFDLSGSEAPASLCAIYEFRDGPAVLDTIARSKGTPALPHSDDQGRMVWRLFETVPHGLQAALPSDRSLTIALLAMPRDAPDLSPVLSAAAAIAQAGALVRVLRLSPIQPSRGADYGAALLVATQEDDLAAAALDAHCAGLPRLLLHARPIRT